MKKAFLYIRVSTDEQAETGFSQRSQHELLTKYCELNNITIVESFFEDHSAKTFNRPVFSKILMTIRKHKNMVNLILFTKWDRFSRNAGDAYQMISTLNKLAVEPQAMEQPLNLEIPENKMMLAFYLAAPEVENDRRALNVINGLRRAQKEGRCIGRAPVGYINKMTEDGHKYILRCESQAPIMLWVFEQLSTGKFTAESIWKHARGRGLKCGKNAFWNAVRNPMYFGKVKLKAYKDEEEYLVPGRHEPLISEALFYEVQDVLDGRKKVYKTPVTVNADFPLRGHLKCPNCNRMLTASASKGRSIYYNYYHCTSSCGVRFNADTLNVSFINELVKWKPYATVPALYKAILKDLYDKIVKNRSSEISSLKDEMTRLNERQKKARELLLKDSIEPDDFRSIKKECEIGIIKIEGKLAEIASIFDYTPLIDKALDVLINIDKLYINADVLEKRRIIGSIFPENLEFDGNAYRTARVNEAVRLIFNIGAAFEEIKNGAKPDILALPHKGSPIAQISNLFLMDLKKLAALAA